MAASPHRAAPTATYWGIALKNARTTQLQHPLQKTRALTVPCTTRNWKGTQRDTNEDTLITQQEANNAEPYSPSRRRHYQPLSQQLPQKTRISPMDDQLQILYANAEHSLLAMHNATKIATKLDCHIIMLTEPYYHPQEATLQYRGWSAVSGPVSAILLREEIEHTPLPSPHQTIVATKVGRCTITCAYASPNREIEEVLDPLQPFFQGISGPIILCGDFNCRTSIIPGYMTNPRGRQFEELISNTHLQISNSSCPTWSRGVRTGINDYICQRSIPCTRYEVLENDSLTDHKLLYSTFTTTHCHKRHCVRRSTMRS